MNIWWLIGYGVASAVIAFDVYLEFSDHQSLSEYVWYSSIPTSVWYVSALVAVNLVFWLWSPVVAAAALGFFLLGHFSQ
ncbi:MAG: hypothetical protein ACRDGM_16360 [bacterium]